MMLLKYSILGALMEHPDYGYNLKARISRRVLHDFGINDNQLYPTLKNLAKEGYIKKEIVYQEGSPNRNVYHILEKGKKYFLEWLKSNEGRREVPHSPVWRVPACGFSAPPVHG